MTKLDFGQFVDRFEARVGMYVQPPTFDVIVGFLCGYDTATDHAALEGFREWLVCELTDLGFSGTDNLVWQGQIVRLAAIETGSDEPEDAIVVLFRRLRKFLAVRQEDGLVSVYNRYRTSIASYYRSFCDTTESFIDSARRHDHTYAPIYARFGIPPLADEGT